MKPRLTFNEETNTWTLETPCALNNVHIKRIIDYTTSIYTLRMHGTIGEKRRKIQEALTYLNPNNIKQLLVGNDKILYYEGKRP